MLAMTRLQIRTTQECVFLLYFCELMPVSATAVVLLRISISDGPVWIVTAVLVGTLSGFAVSVYAELGNFVVERRVLRLFVVFNDGYTSYRKHPRGIPLSINTKPRVLQLHLVHNLLQCVELLRNLTDELLPAQLKRQAANYLLFGMLQQLADFMAAYPIDRLRLNHAHHHQQQL